MKKRHGKAKIILLVVLIIFLIYNVFWYFTVYHKYRNYIEGMKKDALGDYFTTEEGYNYYVYAPRYLGYIFSLTISEEKFTEEGENCSIIVWPLSDKKEKYGVLIEPAMENETIMQIYVDKDLNPIGEVDKDQKNALKANHEKIVNLMEKYNDKFFESE